MKDFWFEWPPIILYLFEVDGNHISGFKIISIEKNKPWLFIERKASGEPMISHAIILIRR